jgi:hypothetical protein
MSEDEESLRDETEEDSRASRLGRSNLDILYGVDTWHNRPSTGQLSRNPMPGVLEETTNQPIDQAHIQRRVKNWLDRIDTLYQQIESWLPPGWTAQKAGNVTMYEELMRKFQIPAQNLPILQLYDHATPAVRIEPRGLWIIGANGRLDLLKGNDHYLIVDAAENFARPDWQIAPLSNRRKLEKFNAQSLNAML